MFTRWALPLGVLVFFAATAAGYGVFRDELYYFACARHLDWGYVDHPPGVALLAHTGLTHEVGRVLPATRA
jgi:hypothetical protein